MGNLCDNTFYAYTEDSKNIETIKDYFDKWPGADVEIDGEQVDVYFSSKWDFPLEAMTELFESIPNKKDIYMRCLSVEYDCLYHALWVCDKDGWEEV